MLIGNHIYLGGYLLSQFVQIVFCSTISKGVFPKNRNVPLLTEGMLLALFARLLTRPARVPPRLHDGPQKLRRLYWKQPIADVEAIASGLGIPRIVAVIARHIAAVMKHLRRDRLRVTLPISFEAEDSFNTVGAIFLDVDAEPDFPSFARKIKKMVDRKRWQVSASNHVQRIAARYSPPAYVFYVAVYGLFTFLQELVARGAAQTALEVVLPGPRRRLHALLLADLLFAATHLHVSAALAAAVFVPGLFWGWLYARQRTLAGVTASHAMLGLYVYFVVGMPLQR